jgi:hypothetical protein
LTEADHLYYNCKCMKYHIAQIRSMLYSIPLIDEAPSSLIFLHTSRPQRLDTQAEWPCPDDSLRRPNGLQPNPPHQPTTPLFSFLPLPPPLSSLYHVLPYCISKCQLKWILLRSISRRLLSLLFRIIVDLFISFSFCIRTNLLFSIIESWIWPDHISLKVTEGRSKQEQRDEERER